MPVKRLPSNPNLDHLKYQAKDLLREGTARGPRAAQRIREFHPHFLWATDDAIFYAPLSLSDAQLTSCFRGRKLLSRSDAVGIRR